MGETIPIDVKADINYFPATAELIETRYWKPRLLGDADEHTRKTTIQNVRGMESDFVLDKNGFQFVNLPSKPRDASTDEKIRGEYYAEIAEVLKELYARTGATTVQVFNYCIRHCADPPQPGSLDAQGRWRIIPSGHLHVDYAGRPSDLRGTLEELQLPGSIITLFTSSSRFAFVNAWRPLATVRRDPLPVANATTVPALDYRIRARELSRTGTRSGNYVLSHHGGEEREEKRRKKGASWEEKEEEVVGQHRWYYMSAMREDEMVIFKGIDTKQDLPGWRCRHTAFVLEGTEAFPPRESIEVRAVCFWE